MPSSTSWQRYDEEHGVSAILTEAARACIVENPSNVADFFAQYFREVAGGTSVKALTCREVIGSTAGPAMTFTLELGTGPEVSTTTCAANEVFRCVSPKNAGKAKDAEQEGQDGEAVNEQYEQLLHSVRSSLIPQLCRLGSVEPQSAWDKVITSVCNEPLAFTSSVQWAVSVLASLATAKQRRLTLYQHFGALIGAHTTSRGDDASVGIVDTAKGPLATHPDLGTNAAATSAHSSSSYVEKSDTGRDGSRRYAPPLLLLPFLVNDASAHGADAAGQVHFAKVYVTLEPITFAAGVDGEEDGKCTADASSRQSIGGGTGAAVAVADGSTLRRRLQQVHHAARLLLAANADTHAGPEGCIYWGGAGSFVEVVKAVTEALEAAKLRPGVDVCLGLSLRGNRVRVRSGGEGDGGVTAAVASTTNTAAATTASSKVAAAAAAAAADLSGQYDFFYGDSAITGEQLTEYLKEQLEEIGQGVVRFLEDTHSMDDTVARQRLQLALQDSVVVCGNDVWASGGAVGLDYADQRTADTVSGTYPATVVDLARCGSLQAAAQLLRTTADAGKSAVTALVSSAAGDAPTSVHLVDLAVAGRAPFLMTSSGPMSATTAAVVSRLATIVAELSESQAAAPRPSLKSFNRYDLPTLPDVDVAPIRRKGDKKKKESRKNSTKKK